MGVLFSALVELALQNLFYLALHLENNAFPKQLSREEERKYLEKIMQGDHEARNKLIEHNLRLVAYIVKKHYADSKDQDDLISIGIIGLIRAAETFNPEKKINFSTYASKCVDNQIKMHFRKIKRQQTEVFMNEPIDSDKDGNQITIADIFKDPSCIADEAELRIDLQKLYNYINEELDEREKQIICKRYGLNYGRGTVEKAMTQREVAKHLNISRSYVSDLAYCKRPEQSRYSSELYLSQYGRVRPRLL
ncbi:MAG: RNA polymerase sporulation sigma factor SigK [Chitinispirillales bacterium]|nr:RNA polymerase sporulation sigma factor SigK [Chitinispirillales bacterium]